MVRGLTREDIDDLFPLIGALEALAGELACERISDSEIAAIERLHADMVAHYRAGRRSEYFRRNQQIHEEIVRASGNRLLADEYRTLSAPLRRARFVANLSGERWAQAVAERLAAILKSHLGHKHDAVRKRLEVETAKTA